MSNQPFTVDIDLDMEDIVPGYLENRKKDIVEIQAAIEKGDWDFLKTISHKIKGNAGGYGFDGLSQIGGKLEEAAKTQDLDTFQSEFENMKNYLANVQVNYVEVA